MRVLLIAVLVILTVANGQAQRNDYTDKVVLKDGARIKGQITRNMVGDSLEIVVNGQTIKLRYDQILAIKNGKFRYRDYSPKQAGYFILTEMNLAFGQSSNWNSTYTSAAFNVVNGYRFDHKKSVGLGVGIDMLDETRLIPVYLHFQSELYESRTTPYFFGSIGYNYLAVKESPWRSFDPDELQGGLYGNVGIGMKLSTKRHSWLFNIGFQLQNYKIAWTDVWPSWSSFRPPNGQTIEETHSLRRVSYKIGFMF